MCGAVDDPITDELMGNGNSLRSRTDEPILLSLLLQLRRHQTPVRILRELEKFCPGDEKRHFGCSGGVEADREWTTLLKFLSREDW
jgi:hypothetical protein